MTKFFALFSKENSIRGASIILIITLTLSNFLGLIRDRFLTKNISTYDLDIYFAGFRIPDLIFNFLILGAITSAFIPVFSDFIAEKKLKEGYRVTNTLLNGAVIAMALFALILFFIMPYITPLVVPNFDSFRMQQTVTISRWLMLTPIFFSISYILGGVLNSFNRFFAYSIAPLVYNLSIIFGAAFLAPKFGIMSVVYCVIGGSILHFLVQLPAAIKMGFSFQIVLDWKDAAIKKIIHLMIPRTIGMGINQVMLIVYTAIASALAAGSISAFNLSNNIQTMPVVVFGTSFATAIFPTLTAKISNDNKNGFSFYLNKAMRSMAFLLIPSTAILILLRAQIVRIILGSGKFSWDDTRMTALSLAFLSLSLIAQGLIPLLARAFYALKNSKTPMYISVVSAIISIVIAYPLARVMGVAGLALSFSIGSYVNAIVLFIFLRRLFPGILNRTVAHSYVITVAITLVMAVCTWITIHQMAGIVDMQRFTGILTQTIVAVAVALAIYLGLSYFFNSQDLKWALNFKKDAKKTSQN